MNITYHFIGTIDIDIHLSKKLPFLPSIHQFNENLFRKHIVFNENQFFPNFCLRVFPWFQGEKNSPPNPLSC